MLQQLAPKYVATGKVKIVYKNFPVIGPESEPAAQAAECAGDQNKFWTYADYLFTHQGSENSGALSVANLKKFATQLGLDPSTFNTCLDSGKYAAQVAQEKAEGEQRNIQATPTLFVNGQRYEGAVPYDQLVKIIDAILTPSATATGGG